MTARSSYPGGKNGAGVYQAIINQMPPHRVYIEPFAGSASIARRKRPARSTIVVDADARAAAELAMLEETLPGCRVVTGCGLAFLEAYPFRGDELVYCDPPYLMGVRRSQRRIYDCELDDRGHARLLDIVVGLPCMVAISGYWSIPYHCALHDWRLLRFTAGTRAGPAEECLWMNYPEPQALHDYRHLGDGYRERERIKRKVGRWRANLAALPATERLAVLSALTDLAHLDASPAATVRDRASPDAAVSAAIADGDEDGIGPRRIRG